MIGDDIELVGLHILMDPTTPPGVIWCYQVHRFTGELLESFPFKYMVWSFNGLRNAAALQAIPIQELTTSENAREVFRDCIARRQEAGYTDTVSFSWMSGTPLLEIPGLPIPEQRNREDAFMGGNASQRVRRPTSNQLARKATKVASELETHASLI